MAWYYSDPDYNQSMGKRHHLWAVCGFALLLSACGGSADPQSVPLEPLPLPTIEATASSTPPIAVPTVVAPGPCQHLLWPLTAGATWEYQLTLSDGSVQPITVTASGSDTGVALMHVAASGTAEYLVACQPNGLSGAYGPLLGYAGPDRQLLLDGPDGPFLPSPDRLLPLETEATWDVEYAVSGSLSLPLPDGPIEAQVTGGKVVLFATTESPFTVSVPAGSYETLPILQSVFFDLRVTADDGRSGSVIIDARSRLYLAERVGLVRRVFEGGTLSGTLGDISFGAALEAGVSLDLLAVR